MPEVAVKNFRMFDHIKFTADLPRDPNHCGYKVLRPTRKLAREQIKATLGPNYTEYHCTVCRFWHFRVKGTKPPNAA